MGNDDDGLVVIAHEPIKGFLYLMLTFSVEGAGSLVKKQDSWLPHQSPGNRNSLLLSARKTYTSLTDHSVNTLRE